MNQIKYITTPACLILVALIAGTFTSCKKDNKEGSPVINKVQTVYKSKVDSNVVYTITYRDSSGTVVADSTSYINTNPQIGGFDSTTTAGNLGNLYAIMGQNLSNVTAVKFNDLPAYFNPALGSDRAILVSIPSNTPSGSDKVNTLTVVTTHGTATFKFTVLAPPPTIVTLSDYNFSSGSQITLAGIGFGSVTAIKLSGTSDAVTIVSQSDSIITLQMPTTSANRANLVFTYGSGTLTSSQEFVNLDNAYQIFTDDFQNSWQDASWSGPSGRSTATAVTGVASYVITYPAGGWKIEGAANWYPSMNYDPSYKYLSFYIKGGTTDHTLVLVGDQMDGGYSQNTSATAWKVAVPAKVWTYYKIPLGAPASTDAKLLNFWKNANTAKQLGFFLQGQTGDVDETMYLDDLIFVK